MSLKQMQQPAPRPKQKNFEKTRLLSTFFPSQRDALYFLLLVKS